MHVLCQLLLLLLVYSGLLYPNRPVFQNAECLRKYGLPLPPHIFSDSVDSQSEEVRKARRSWGIKILAVHSRMH